MNVSLLIRMLPRILSEPERIDIEVPWACGMAYCLGGLALDLAGKTIDRGNAYQNPFEDARDVCGLTSDEAERLFILTAWPAPLRHQYRDAATPLKRAEVVVQRLNFFIETEGRA